MYQMTKFGWYLVQKMYSKMHLGSCTNTYHDVKNLVKYMVKNTKTSVS